MAYIQPDSDIKILKGVPLDKDYNHSLLFQQNTQGLIDQYNTFAPLAKYTLSNYSYQRYEKGAIRVQIPIANLYDCNYMMFKNSAYDSKWFYAFITQCEYVNDNTTTIHYQLDELQSWWADFTVEQSFVVREHSKTDVIGENIVAEPLSVGEMIPVYHADTVYTSFDLLIYYSSYDKAIMYSDGQGKYITVTPADAEKSAGVIEGGMFGGFRILDVGTININDHTTQTLVKERTGMALKCMMDSNPVINPVAIVIAPTAFYNNFIQNGWTNSRTYTIGMTKKNMSKNGTRTYLAKNNKLYTYPFKKIIVSNFGGTQKEFQWENFSTPEQASFKEISHLIPLPEMAVYPITYKNIAEDYESLIMINDFPTCSWTEDTFSKWWAQNRDAVIYNALISGIAIIAGAVAGGAMAKSGGESTFNEGFKEGLKTSAPMGVANAVGSASVESAIRAYNSPDDFKGKLDVSGFKLSMSKYGYRIYDVGVDYETAEIIDNYFTMYGYAVNKVKYPNVFTQLHIRPHWNYLQATNAHIHPALTKGLPTDSEEIITKILNKGITFWNNINEVGNYSLDNSPQV